MSLPEDYLRYPRRRYGMDHDLYDWSALPDRAPVRWPGDADVALWITPVLEFFPLTPNDGPFRAPGHMVTPFPDLRSFTTKDYGNRVGIFRLLDVLSEHGLPASVPMNAVLADRYPALVAAVTEADHEIIAHGWDMNHLHHGDLDEDAERRIIRATLDRLSSATGQDIAGWMSPARSESANTPRLLAEAGLRYLCDWVNDDMPYPMHTDAGPVIAMPSTQDLDDRKCMIDLGHGEDVWQQQILDAADVLQAEAQRQGGRILHVGLTPYVAGQPFRIGAVRELLADLARRPGFWPATGRQILDAWQAG